MVDGRKLPPYIVLRRKTLPKVNVKGVIIQAQESGQMNGLMACSRSVLELS
jgi:hypothetical protein